MTTDKLSKETELDLTENEQAALDDGAITLDTIREARYWSSEGNRIREKMAPLLAHVDKQDDMRLCQHGSTTRQSGVHEVSLTFEVEGEPYDE